MNPLRTLARIFADDGFDRWDACPFDSEPEMWVERDEGGAGE